MNNPETYHSFEAAEGQYRSLEAARKSKRLSSVQYEAELAKLQVIDASGQTWMLQSYSGQWHVYSQGRWVASQPPRSAAQPLRSASQTLRSASQSPKSNRKPLYLIAAAGLLAVCLLVAVVGAGGYWYLNRQPDGTVQADPGLPAPETQAGELADEPESPLIFTPRETVLIAPDGSLQRDAAGVGLSVPPGATHENAQVKLVAMAPEGEAATSLPAQLGLVTQFYAVQVDSANDGAGAAELVLPAADPNARVLTLIDGQYPGFLAIEPQNGELRLPLRLFPGIAQGEMGPSGSGEVLFAVAVPEQAGLGARTAASPLAGLLPVPLSDPKACLNDYHWRGKVIRYCRQTSDGAVQVRYYAYTGLTKPQADTVADTVKAAMAAYMGKGFTTAGISAQRPVQVVVTEGVSSPLYYVANGVVYLPPDSAKSMAGFGGRDLLHELAHWIQDEEYVMSYADKVGSQKWWLETSAENMVMLLDPTYADKNLSEYGKINLSGASLVLQGAPYQWPVSEYYGQAQLLKINICSNPACPLTETSFAAAISTGEFPLDEATARAKVHANLDDYAIYLLGGTPPKANWSIHMGKTVQEGIGYGDVVQVLASTKGPYILRGTNVEPQLSSQGNESDPATSLAIQAPLEKDGVYPLTVLPGEGKSAGFPALLKIEPGPPFWYRLGKADPVFNDGKAGLVLGPIHPSLGLPSVRLAALGENGGEVFKARLEFLDLSGTWLLNPVKILSDNVTCTTTGEGVNANWNTEFPAQLLTVASSMGSYTSSSGQGQYMWAHDPDRDPGGDIQPMLDLMEFHSRASIVEDKIIVQSDLTIKPPPTSALPPQPSFGLLAFFILPLGVAVAAGRRPRRRLALMVLALLSLVLLTACSMFGTLTSEATLTRIEPIAGGSETLGLVLDKGINTYAPGVLRLSAGSALVDVDISISGPSDINEQTSDVWVTRCTGTLSYELSVDIYKDAQISWPEE